MTHLRIEQNGITEEVSSSVISKLYEIVHAGVDASSNLQGRLHTPISYREHVQYLTTNYPNLYILSDDYAIPFEDPKMVTYLNSIGVGSNGMITEALAAAATIVANSANTQVTKFNELKYFTNVTESRGGWTGVNSGYTRFAGWTTLEEIDISNFTSLGHVSALAYEDTLGGCTALKTVTASDKLTRIGVRAFYGCTNLEHIIGLSGTIQISNLAFAYCSKLPDEDIANVEFEPAYEGTNLRGSEAFIGTNFTEITLSTNTTKIPNKMFLNCSNLETVNRLGSNITSYGSQCFQGCTKFTGPIDFTNVTYIGASAFHSSGLTGAVDLLNISTIENGTNFTNSNITSVNYRGNTISGFSGSFSGCKNLTTASGMLNVLVPCNDMFNGCTSLTTVDIDWQTVSNHTIPVNCFKNCTSLLSIDLTGVVRLKQNAFLGCTALTAITLPNTLTAIEDTVFRDSGLEELTIPSSVTYLGLFNNVNSLKVVRCLMLRLDYLQFQSNKKYFSLTSTSLTTLELPEGVFEAVEIGSALPNNELGLTMNLPASVEIFSCGYSHGNTLTFAQGSNLQYMCGLGYYTTVNSFDWTQSLTSSIINIIDGLRACCFKNVVNFPKNNLKFLPGFFFSGNSEFTGVLSDIIGDNLIAIGKNAFNGMGSLSYQIVLPSTLKYIGYGAFNRTNPTSYKILATTPPEIGNVVFDSNYNNAFGCDIYVPAASVQAYQTATNWSRYASRIVAIPT